MEHVVFKRIPRISPELIARARLCAVADLLESMPEAEGAARLMHGGIRAVNKGIRVAGQAITARNHPGDNMMIYPALESAQRGDILVLTSGGAAHGPLWGDMTCCYAVVKGVGGVIVDGAVRDTDFILQQRFPVWAAHVSASHPTKAVPGTVNVPVLCGGVIVTPGDLIVADSDGVLAVPIAGIGDVVAKAEARSAKEDGIRDQIEKGRSLYDLLEYDRILNKAGVRIVDEAWTPGRA